MVDSLNLSSAQGLIVMEGAELAQDQTLDEVQIAQRLREIVPKVDGSFVLEDLEYLRKGGRCSTVAALGANLLGIKPCIEVHNGQMGVAKKYRGAYEKALRNYVRERLEGNDTLRTHRIMITHTPVDDGIVDMVRDEIFAVSALRRGSAHRGARHHQLSLRPQYPGYSVYSQIKIFRLRIKRRRAGYLAIDS